MTPKMKDGDSEHSKVSRFETSLYCVVRISSSLRDVGFLNESERPLLTKQKRQLHQKKKEDKAKKKKEENGRNRERTRLLSETS